MSGVVIEWLSTALEEFFNSSQLNAQGQGCDGMAFNCPGRVFQ